MIREVRLNLNPASAASEDEIKKISATLAHVRQSEINSLRIIKRSVDARNSNIRVNLIVELFTGDDSASPEIKPYLPLNVRNGRDIIIVGAGPAGLFAALRLIELGLKPVILERGRDVSARKRDIAEISRNHTVDPDSNFCFGEGGAGTFSDGKLYTRSKKRGDNSRVLELLCIHGANRNIMYEAHPHLGTDKLPRIITALRQSIIDAGGEFLMEKRVEEILADSSGVRGVRTADGETFRSNYIILATGHSARDIYRICLKTGIDLEMKSFAMGVRVEHPQEQIDMIQYHGKRRGEYLPAAAYNLAKQINGRGVYSFCMCPGGFIVPSATSQEEVVVNGMSPSERNSPYANSGIVVEIRPDDLAKYSNRGELAGVAFQEELERDAWINGGRKQSAPAQRLADFVSGKSSGSLPKVSYFPGITSSPLHEWLPPAIRDRLRDGFRQFGQIMKGYLTNDAVILGVESRTSSPVRIPRDSEKLYHNKFHGLYPCGEGSGYSGGIVSSAVDGMNVAEAIAKSVSQNSNL